MSRLKNVQRYPVATVLTLLTGVIMTTKGVVECAGHLLGYSIFVHEIPDAEEQIKAAILAQHPQLGDVEPIEAERPDAAVFLGEYLKRQVAKYGATLPLARGDLRRTESPVRSLKRVAPHMHVDVAIVR